MSLFQANKSISKFHHLRHRDTSKYYFYHKEPDGREDICFSSHTESQS